MVLITACASQAGSLKPSDMSGWTVVVAEDAIPSERYAAEEFRSLFNQATGVELAAASKPPKPGGKVLIGPGASGLKVDDLGEEGLRISIKPHSIAIAGGRPRGTLYGVYEFLERYFGVRFLTNDHTYFPPGAARKIPCEDYSYRPPFSFRWTYYKENADYPAFAAKLRVNTTTPDEKLGGITGQRLINHSLYYLIPVEKYGKEHPEYFALVDGVRKLEMGGGGPEVCSTNAAVVDIVTEAVLREIEAHPHQTNFSVSQNDNDAYCRCPNCEAVNQREGTPMGSHLALVNAVAERVAEKHPNVKIGTLAYWYTRKPPRTIVPRENVQIQLCSIECCTLHPINDKRCERNRAFCADVAAWKAISNDIWIWNYNTNFRFYDLPFPNLRSIGPNVRYFRDNNVHGVFMQANGNGNSGEMCDLRNYVISRCLWNPSLNSWKLAEEFCRLHYGKAAGPIWEYLTMIHDNAQAAGMHPTCFPGPAELALTPEIAVKSYNCFQQALALADDHAVRARVEKASIPAYRALIELCVLPKPAKTAVVLPLNPSEIIDRYADLCRRYNMTMASEGQAIGDYIEGVRRAVLGRR